MRMCMYRNCFEEIGVTEAQVDKKIYSVFQTMFFDPVEKIYFDSPGSMGFMMDTGNMDARTEGMSYGMMMAVQMDRKDIFDRLWLYSLTYMLHRKGEYQGYFAWSVKPSGEKNFDGPAPDGEEYYAMALFFASARWGDGEEFLNYSSQAKEILRHCVHQDELFSGGMPMWDRENHLIKYVPEADFSDPSYHLPHFYELFAQRADEKDRAFWKAAASASRRYVEIASHPVTGMASEYAEYDGTPKMLFGKKQQFFADAYRVAMNIGLDAAWFGRTEALTLVANRLQAFFAERTELGMYDSYMLDGTPIGMLSMHPTAVIATLAAASIASTGDYRLQWLKDFWSLPLRKGVRRYYDNCLYFFSLLMLAGRYKIY